MPVPADPGSLTLRPLGTTVTVSTGYDAAATSIVLTAGHGARLPTPTGAGYSATWWNDTDFPANPLGDSGVEHVTITAKSTDTLTVTRGQRGSSASAHNTGGKTYKITVYDNANLGSTCTELQWIPGDTTETGFKIERNINAAGWVEILQTTEFKDNTATVTWVDWTGDIPAGSSVDYRVRAFNGTGNSGYATSSGAVVLGSFAVPAAPTSVSATWTTTGVNVTWSHAAVGAWLPGTFHNTIFQVWRSESSSGPFTELIGGGQNNGSYLDRQWEFSKTYYYKVRGWHFAGMGPFSSVSASVATASATSPVANIASLPATVYVGEAIKFSGSASTYVVDLPRWTGTAVEYPYTWDFGAGEDTGYHLRETEYTFRTPGAKTVTLTVRNPAGTSNATNVNFTVVDVPVSTDTPHSCTAGESGGSVSAVHRPTTYDLLQDAITASLVQNDPLIELTTGTTDYVSASGGSLVLKKGRTGLRYCTIRPLNYSTNFTNQKRVTSTDISNLAKISITAANSSDMIVVSEPDATNPSKYYRLQGIQLRKTTATESQPIDAGFALRSFAGYTPPNINSTSTLPHHFILQHIYIDGDPQTSHWHMGVSFDPHDSSLLDSHIDNIKVNGGESYGIYINTSLGRQVIDNCKIYGFSMAIFYASEDTLLGPNEWARHVTVRRSYLTRRAADEVNGYFTGGSFNWKNLFETKRLEFFAICGNMFGPTWNHAQPGAAILIKAVSQNNDSNYSTTQHGHILNNVYRNIPVASGASYVDVLARDPGLNTGGGSRNTNLPSLIFQQNNLGFDGVGGTSAWSATQFFLIPSSELPTYQVVDHNTFLNRDIAVTFGNGGYIGGVDQKAHLTIANSYWFGYIKGAQAGVYNKMALDQYARAYTFMGNIAGGDVGGHSAWSGIDASNKFPVDDAAVGWTDYTNRDLRLSGSSPYRAAGADPATDGTDRGANLTTIYNQLGGTSYAFGVGTTNAETGDWAGGIVPATASLTLTTFAPTVTATGALTPATATLTTTMFAPNVTVSGSRAPAVLGRSSISGRCSIL